MKKQFLYITFVLATFLLSSCAQAKPTFFDVIGLPENQFNTNLTLETIENITELKVGKGVDFDGVNHTASLIQVVADQDIRVFKLNSDSEWVEIGNKLSYGGRIIDIPTKETDPFGIGSFWLDAIPDNCKEGEISDVRIVVVGSILDEENPETVGAYLDVTLEP
jgi:hypothetical protein